MRSQEQGKFFGDIAKTMAEMRRLEELKENSVQKDEESDGLNPDGSGGGQEQQHKKKEGEEEQPESNLPAGHPIKLDGGDILDIMA
jgi:hypothetical protein